MNKNKMKHSGGAATSIALAMMIGLGCSDRARIDPVSIGPVSTNVLAVTGSVTDGAGTDIDSGTVVTVTNERRSTEIEGITGAVGAHGTYSTAFVDLDSNKAATDGDVLRFSVSGHSTVGTATHTVTPDEIEAKTVVFDMEVESR